MIQKTRYKYKHSKQLPKTIKIMTNNRQTTANQQKAQQIQTTKSQQNTSKHIHTTTKQHKRQANACTKHVEHKNQQAIDNKQTTRNSNYYYF